MGFAAELIMDVEDDVNWSVAGDTFGLIFTQVCVNAGNKLGRSPSPPPIASKSPSPNLLAAQDGVKNVIGAVIQGMDDADSEDMRSTVGGCSILAEDSRSTVEDFIGDSDPIQAAIDKALGNAYEAGLDKVLGRDGLGDTIEAAIDRDLAQDGLGRPAENESPMRSTTEMFDSVFPPPPKTNLEEVREKAWTVLEKAAQDGTLEEAVAMVSGGRMPSNANEDGNLEAAPTTLDVGESNPDMVRELTRNAIMQGLADGRLDALLAEASGQVDGNNLDLADASGEVEADKEEVRELTRTAMLQGLADGRLDALLAGTSGQGLSNVLVPQPPPDAPPSGCSASPVRARRLLAGSNLEQVMQMISDADRKVGSLQVQVSDKERQLKDREVMEQQITENIQFVRSDLEHLSIDLSWHQEQIQTAEDRWGRLNEDRRALALKLDEMRLNSLKDKDDWEQGSPAKQTGRSWTSTVTGGATNAVESAYSGFNTERSAISSQTFVTQNPPGTS